MQQIYIKIISERTILLEFGTRNDSSLVFRLARFFLRYAYREQRASARFIGLCSERQMQNNYESKLIEDHFIIQLPLSADSFPPNILMPMLLGRTVLTRLILRPPS